MGKSLVFRRMDHTNRHRQTLWLYLFVGGGDLKAKAKNGGGETKAPFRATVHKTHNWRSEGCNQSLGGSILCTVVVDAIA